MLLYIHLPFCKSKCAYCDFNSYANCDAATVFSYLTALNREIDFAADKFSEAKIDTVYIGGGTPSSLDPKVVERIMKRLSQKFRFFNPSEVSIEVNPESVTEDKLKVYHDCGINRVSMGVQSLNDDNLKSVGRLHDAKTAIQKAELAAKYFDNLSADFIIGLPYDTNETVRNEISEFAPLVQHMSVYELTLEENTPLCNRVNEGTTWLPSDDEVADYLDIAIDVLHENGLERYEVSNFARAGRVCRHNYGYWTREEYVGLGAGAHSLVKTADGKNPAPAEIRFASPRDLNAYIGGINCVSSFDDVPRVGMSVLSPRDIAYEKVMLGLRTTEGIDEKLLDGKDLSRVKSFFRFSDGKAALTREGIAVMNSVLTEII